MSQLPPVRVENLTKTTFQQLNRLNNDVCGLREMNTYRCYVADTIIMLVSLFFDLVPLHVQQLRKEQPCHEFSEEEKQVLSSFKEGPTPGKPGYEAKT